VTVKDSSHGEEAALLLRVPPLAKIQAEGGGAYKKCRDCGKYSDIPSPTVLPPV
jgi:hypothetical protein